MWDYFKSTTILKLGKSDFWAIHTLAAMIKATSDTRFATTLKLDKKCTYATSDTRPFQEYYYTEVT